MSQKRAARSPKSRAPSSGQSTPAAGTSYAYNARDTADESSPTRKARLQEKLELVQLNDRLKHYIEEVRQTKQYNSDLLVVVERAKRDLLVETQNYETSIAETGARLITAEREAVSSEAQYRTLLAENCKLRKQVAGLEQNIQELQSQFGNANAKFEFERQSKVELQGRIEVIKRDLESLRQAHIQELVEVRRLVCDEANTPHPLIEGIDVNKLRSEIEGVIINLKQQIATGFEKSSQQEKELHTLKEKYEAVLKEHHEMVGEKVPIKSEIAYYRELLEAEEDRLHLSPPAKKQRRDDPPTVTPTVNQQQFSFSSSSSGCFEISEVDCFGRYIKVKNNSSKTESLAGYSIVNEADAGEGLVFRFHSKFKLQGGADVTVWGHGAEGAKHASPSNVIWKAQKLWSFGNASKTKLLNRTHEIVASYTTKKENTPSKKHSPSQRTRLFHRSDVEEKQEVPVETPTPTAEEHSACLIS